MEQINEKELKKIDKHTDKKITIEMFMAYMIKASENK